MPFAPVNRTDPFLQEPGDEHPCDTCGHSWRLNGFRPPAFHRVTVSVNPEAAWAHVVKILTARVWGFGEEAQGVLSRLSNGQRRYVIFPQFAAETWHDPGRASYGPVCWFCIDAGDVEGYGDHGVTLAEVLARKGKPIRAALDLGSIDSLKPPAPVPGSAAHGPKRTPSRPPQVQAVLEDDLDVRLIQQGDEGIYLGDTKFVDEKQQRIALLFSLLQEITDQDAVAPRSRPFHKAKELVDLHPDIFVEEQHVHQWVRRVRVALERTFRKPGFGKQVIESAGRKGIRLGPQFMCVRFSVQVELDAYKRSLPAT